MNDKMILAGREIHQNSANCFFAVLETEIPTADYLVAGSIFRVICFHDHCA